MPHRHRHVPHPRRADLHKTMHVGDRAADLITGLSGSWPFVWAHTAWFACWFIFGLDINLLTLIVSLEAIYLATFVLMSQNRQADRDRVLQSREAEEVEQDLLLTQEIHHMSGEIHEMVTLLKRIASEQREERRDGNGRD